MSKHNKKQMENYEDDGYNKRNSKKVKPWQTEKAKQKRKERETFSKEL